MKFYKKKILFVITHLQLGGAQKLLLWLIKNLDRDKYSLYLFAGDYGYIKKEFIGIPYLKVKFIPELVRPINPLYDLIAFFKLYSYIRKEGFDIVHTHSPKASILAIWAAYLAGVKNIICTVHGWPFHEFISPFSYRFLLWLERLTARITEKIIVESKGDLKIGVDKKIAPPDKFILIRHGVDIELLESIFSGRIKNPPAKDLIVNISTYKRQKDLNSFLETARLILDKDKRLRFSLIGDGPLRKEIIKAVENDGLKDHISLEGWVRDLSQILSTASLLVLTSLWEGLPLIVIEAIIAGVPVVVTDTGGVSDVVENYRNGIIVKPKDTEKLSEAVLSILDRYDEWQKMIMEDREKMDLSYWSQKRMVEEIESVYERP